MPNKKERDICWNARDKYFECLESKNDDESKCQDLKAAFEKGCPPVWVNYFVKRRLVLKYKEEIELEREQQQKEQQKQQRTT